MFILDLKSRVPIYEQLKNKTLELIMAGVLEQDSQLPSVRSLARELGVNPNTIQKAYQDMEKEGIIYSVAGKGSFVNDINSVKQKEVNQAFEHLEAALKQLKEARADKAQVMACVEKIFSEEDKV
ncbi:MAG: GntR family transcriptional regulator [Oscillospiraceae bacterium]|nr:GntR family transcriptional regulator [Oscillospiraceae bacterium]